MLKKPNFVERFDQFTLERRDFKCAQTISFFLEDFGISISQNGTPNQPK